MSQPSEHPAELAAGESTVRVSWLLILGAVAIGAALLIGYFGVLSRLIAIWSNKPDYSHGFVVPLVSAAYLWLRREMIVKSFRKDLPVSAVVCGVSVLALAGITRVIGILGRALPVEAFSLLLVAAGLTLLLCGFPVFFRVLPACLFLIFMVPLPGGLSSQLRGRLQVVATKISVFSLQTMGVPALSRGNVIVLPDAEVGVAEACSGIRMLVAFAALVTAAVMFLGRSLFDNVILLLSIVPIALIVNAWRVVVVSLATQYAPEWSDTVHDAAGLAMMLLAAAILWGLLKFLDALFSDPESSSNLASEKVATA